MILAVVTPAATPIDLSPIIDPLIQLGSVILTGVVAWASLKVARFAHISTQSAALQQVLGAVDRGIAYGAQIAQQKADASASALAAADIQSETQRQAVNYVVTKMPDTLKSLGMTPQHVADLVLAKLPPP